MKKAQIGLEILTNYGWVLVAIMVITGTLFGFGVLNPKPFKQDNCWFDAGIACAEYYAIYIPAVGPGWGTVTDQKIEVHLFLRNDFREDITITGIDHQFTWKGGNCLPGAAERCSSLNSFCGFGSTPAIITPGTKREITLNCTTDQRKDVEAQVSITYKKTDFGKYDKTVEGKAELQVR